MDHKRALDGDQGLNTGGMGTVAPNPYYTAEVAEQLHEGDFPAHHRGHERRGHAPSSGCLYFGLMLTSQTAPR